MTDRLQRNLQEPSWFKSTYSNPRASCVEVRSDTGETGIRDSKHPRTGTATGPTLAVPGAQWTAFLHHVRT